MADALRAVRGVCSGRAHPSKTAKDGQRRPLHFEV